MKRKLPGFFLFLAFLFILIPTFSCQNVPAKDIVIFADTQGHYDTQRQLVAAVLPFKPGIIFRVGDNVDDGNDPEQWRMFREIHEPLLKTAENFPALGNHDRDSPFYFEQFPFLEGRLWYSVERQGIHFVILDTNSDLSPGSEQYGWLQTDLATVPRDVRFRIVMFHHPIFSAGRHIEDEKGIRSYLMPLFKQYGVNLVFSGHDHAYQRLEYEDVTFVVTGGGGANLYDQKEERPYLKAYHKTNHFCLLSVRKDSLRIQVINLDSRIIDEFFVAPGMLAN